MPVQEINANYTFTDGEVLSFTVNYKVATDRGFVPEATVTVRAKRSLGYDQHDVCTLHFYFSSITSLFISEDFKNESRISDITLKQLEDGDFYIALHPYNNQNEPNEKDNFVIQAEAFTFDMGK